MSHYILGDIELFKLRKKIHHIYYIIILERHKNHLKKILSQNVFLTALKNITCSLF